MRKLAKGNENFEDNEASVSALILIYNVIMDTKQRR